MARFERAFVRVIANSRSGNIKLISPNPSLERTTVMIYLSQDLDGIRRQ
jgi:hypothetical protein